MNNAYLLSLDDYTLEEVFQGFEWKCLYEIAKTCTHFRDICVNMWRCLPKNLECINGIEGEFDGDLNMYRFYVCIMAGHLKSLRLYTSDIALFSEASEKCKLLTHLKALRIVNNYGPHELAPARFLKQCVALENVELCQALLEEYHEDILNLPQLKHLQVLRLMRSFDCLMKGVIIPRGATLRKMQIPIEIFPPIWLCDELETYCTRLEEIIFETRCSQVARFDLNRPLPTMPSLKTIKIMGTNFCRGQLLRFALQCPNLEKMIFYFNNTKDDEVIFKANFLIFRNSDEREMVYCIHHEDKAKVDHDDYQDLIRNMYIKYVAELYFH